MTDFAGDEGLGFRYGERRTKRHGPSFLSAGTGTALVLRAPKESEAAGALATVTVVSKDEIRTMGEWAFAFAGQYKDSRYYDIVQETLHPEFTYRYFVLRDAAGNVRAIQPFFVLDQDVLAGASRAVRAPVDLLRRVWPKALALRTLMVGCAAGEGHLDSQNAFNSAEACELLAAAALKEAKRERAGLVVFKEFPAKYRDQLRHLLPHGFTRLPSLPMASLDIGYRDFDDYLAKALSRATRKDLRRKFKAAQAANLKMTVVNDITPFIDEVFPLYLNVYRRSKLHFEKLTKEYFCGLGKQMPERTRFFIWRQGGRAVAFNLCMVHGDAIYDQYIGLDYTVALDLHLYHYTFRDIIDWAIANGYCRYVSNGLNYDPKFHLRMTLDPLDLYVRHRSRWANAIMKALLPWLAPTQYDANLKRFPNFAELRG